MNIKARIDAPQCILDTYGWKRERKTLELIDYCQEKFNVLRGKATIIAYSFETRKSFIQNGDDKAIAKAAVETITAIKTLCKVFGVDDKELKEKQHGYKGTN